MREHESVKRANTAARREEGGKQRRLDTLPSERGERVFTKNLVRRLMRLVHHHLVVELVADDQLVRELHAVRLHGMGRPIVELPDLRVVQVGHAVLN